MEFRNPWFLSLLFLVVAPLLYWVWTRRGNGLVLPFDLAPKAKPGHWWKAGVNLAEMLPILLLAMAIILWAGPIQHSEPKSKRALTNIEFCVDISGSMTAEFEGGTRYDGSMA
ncbi:MAG: aerotolerance regulator BatA, partial [Verrucomicrobiota bacterium]